MDFGLAITSSIEVKKKYIITELSDDLEEYFKVKNYGNDLKSIVVGIVCVSPNFEKFFKIKKPIYTKGKKEISDEDFTYTIEDNLEYNLKLNFSEFQSLSEEEARKIIAKEILLSLDNLDSVKKKIRDFDWEQFKQDLENYLKKRNLI
ncbi:hypothetical protein EG349_19790 (plasmid) [Chryseobacterium shandongense]|jgi:predicted HTH domain antitoxin|uniref:Uncharacterized protein n=1 Tax=Chryseobacterium shandongense TaxID=1493872 RepID=A0AAD0YGI3_9FLAO|nr:hypothetical protein [Chryseobacterium shandongense]AZA89070.1 hypothetical protein EG349_19790 [Chryseobacterium shandongense]AZA98081.1 hypothetical protein EG353_21075 [Chryseobacterium shandongense]